MANKKTNPSTGPRTAAGKAESSLNALTHGIRSSRLLLPHENPEEYQALLQSLCLDLQPVGALEQLLVDRIAGVVWRKLRMEGGEQAILTAVQMHSATDKELQDALELSREKLPAWMYAEGDFGVVMMRPLPDWMRDPKTLPSADEGAYAAGICREWEAVEKGEILLESEEDARREAPFSWRLLDAEGKRMEPAGDAALAIKIKYNPDTFIDGFFRYMGDKYKAYYWVAYCHRNSSKIEAAFRAIRAKRMLKEWEPEKSHRYTTMLDNQLFKLLREFREMRAWRLANLDMVNDAEPPSSASDAQIVAKIAPVPAAKEASPRRRKRS